MKRLFLIACFIPIFVHGQQGIIKGRIYNSINNEPVAFANIILQGTQFGATSDIQGNYTIDKVVPGLYNLQTSYVGFKSKVIYEVQVTNSKVVFIDFPLEENVNELQEVEVTSKIFEKKEESPVSLNSIGVNEIERNPGGNRDISKTIQSLPGVASGVSFRNDIIIRGGAPNENRFYLDGIEVPNINHFATQGSSGGPVGLINVNFIQNVDFYSGAFPANRGNTLSSILEFQQKDGNAEKLETNFTLGSSDVGITFEGPVSKKSTFIFSVRRSYLQFLFQALQLPFLPTYNDSQFKYKLQINDKNQLTIIGLGAIDDFVLNTKTDNIKDKDVLERNLFFLGNIPENKQWNYTVGANYKHFSENSYQTIVVSRNHLNNQSEKYKNNDATNPTNLLLKYASEEIENKFRFENTLRKNGFKLNYGLGFENVGYKNSSNTNDLFGDTLISKKFSSDLTFNKYSVFGQLSKTLLANRLVASLGLRTDFNDYSEDMQNPIDQFSPRLSLSYSIAPNFNINFNVGRYFQLPAYTILGFRSNQGVLVNKSNNVTYIGCDHLVGGIEYFTKSNTKISVEGFYKVYSNYPFLLRDSITLANLGGDFGVIGNEAATSISDGRAYGIEFLAQRKLAKGFYGIVAYTYVKSEFKDKKNKFVPSAWDNGNILSLTGGKKFKRNWELGARFRFLGGAPFTPVNENISSLKTVWDSQGQGVFDYNQLNANRNPSFNQLDVRIDKRYFFKKWSLNFYLDIQNIYNATQTLEPIFSVQRDANGAPINDPDDNLRYEVKKIKNINGGLVPSIGLVIEL